MTSSSGGYLCSTSPARLWQHGRGARPARAIELEVLGESP
jgi:hypothetical protein